MGFDKTAIERIFKIPVVNVENFQRAVTHSSYTKENNMHFIECYERLEFLGDAVLKLTISDCLFKKFPEYSEGALSKIRSIVVSDAVLAEIAKKNGLSELIIMSRHEEKQGCRNLESVCACAFEAVLGAYYLDGKFRELLEYINTTFASYIEEVDSNSSKYNAKAVLQEYTQGLTKETPVYRVVAESGPAHKRDFEVEVSYQENVIAKATGRSKKEAEQKCAYEACKILGVIK